MQQPLSARAHGSAGRALRRLDEPPALCRHHAPHTLSKSNWVASAIGCATNEGLRHAPLQSGALPLPACSRRRQAAVVCAAAAAAAAGSGATPVVEPTVLAPGAEAEGQPAPLQNTAEAEELQAEAEWEVPSVVPEVPESVSAEGTLLYGLLGCAYALTGVGLALAALRAPGLLLPSAVASGAWGSVLLGCLVATHLRAAGAALHLCGVSDNGELLCWRHHRLAAGLAAYGVAAAACGLLASPQLAGLHLALGAATAYVAARVAATAWRVSPFVSSVLHAGSPAVGAAMLLRSVADWVSTVAAVLLLGAAALGLWGFASVVLSPTPAPPPILGAWPGVPPPGSLTAAEAGLRRLVGCGLLLAAAQSAALLDFAPHARQGPTPGDLDAAKRDLLEKMARLRDPSAKYYLPDPVSYNFLNLSYVVAAAVQAYFVGRAPGLGVDVNLDAALWGPLYGTWFVPLVYGLAAAAAFDWGAVAEVVGRVAGWAYAQVMRFFNAFVWKIEWAEKSKRS